MDQTAKVWQIDMTAIAGCRAEPKRHNKDLEKAPSVLSTGSLNPGMSSTGTIRVRVLRQGMARSATWKDHFKTPSSIRYCQEKHFGGAKTFSGLG